MKRNAGPLLQLWICVIVVAGPVVAEAEAISQPYIQRQLSKLSPEEAVEQRCDIEAMQRIDADHKRFHPDKVIAYTFGNAKIKGTAVKAKGAVFRSQNEWYRLAYICELRKKTLEVKRFDYDIGRKVRRSEWGTYYLYD